MLKINKLYMLFLIILNGTNLLYSQILTINIEKNVNLNSMIKCSEYFSEFKYIILETQENALIGANPKVDIVDEFIFVKTMDAFFVFDKNTGKFLRKIGSKGKGPGEYRNALGFVNPLNKHIYLFGWNYNLLVYNFSGSFIKSIKIPNAIDSFKEPSVPIKFTFFKRNIACYFTNCIGNEKKLVMIFNEEGEEIITHPNENVFDIMPFSLSTGESHFYHYNNNLYFKEDYNDTIYKVSVSGLEPIMVINTGKFKLPYESKWWSHEKRRQSKYLRPSNFLETKSFIFFKFFWDGEYLCNYYRKKDKSLITCNCEKGFINDIDNFIYFIPKYIDDQDNAIALLEAYEITEWFNNNPEKAKKLPPHLKKLKHIKETDNPVVMIAKLKE